MSIISYSIQWTISQLSKIFGEYIIRMLVLYLMLINMIPVINNLAGRSFYPPIIISIAMVLLTISWCASMLEDVGFGLRDDKDDNQKLQGGNKKI